MWHNPTAVQVLQLYGDAIQSHKENHQKYMSESEDFPIGKSLYVDFTQGYGPLGLKPRMIQLSYQRNAGNKEEQVVIHIGTLTSLQGKTMSRDEAMGQTEQTIMLVQTDPDWERILAAYPIKGHGNFDFPQTLVSMRDREARKWLPLSRKGDVPDPFYGLRVRYDTNAEHLQLNNLTIAGLRVCKVGTPGFEVGNPPGASPRIEPYRPSRA